MWLLANAWKFQRQIFAHLFSRILAIHVLFLSEITLRMCHGLDLLDTQVQGIFYNVFTQKTR